eukprot:CAMPEP_0176499868 /NCGR_PEP_ID=MMETSP0200_2-20121128/13190_1 /TAXON_ID=947934 /ORGANISM="Chaetoceros sp., Strain GSL56" /LENGTH=849 /DNA_ID=CAMNT_0017898383 /DNA_START=482 /DNA_END=3031 /DNA_ORIENTATION=-
MMQEPLIPVMEEKMNRSYVSSCSDEEEEDVSLSSSSFCFKSKEKETASDKNTITGPSNINNDNDYKRVADKVASASSNVGTANDGSLLRTRGDDIQVRSVSPSSQRDQPSLLQLNSSLTSQNENTNDGQKDPKSLPCEIGEDVSTSSASSSTKSRDALQARIVSLEEQIKSLTFVIQSLQPQRQSQKPQHEQITNSSTTCSPILNHMKTSDLSGSESPTFMDHDEHSNVDTLSRRDHDDMDNNNNAETVVSLSHAPDLEYRSYTPNYEKELWNIRKTSRGMSLDQNDSGASLSDNGTMLSGSKRSSRNQLQDIRDDIRDIAVCNNTTNVNKTIDATLKSETNNHIDSNHNNIFKGTCRTMETTTVGDEKLPPKQSAGDRTPTIPPSSAKISTSPNLSTLSARLRSATTLKHVEEKMNTNAVVDFIRGLNIDSRRQDGSATEDVDANMEEFLRVPFRIENLLFFGLAICFDSFLNVLTVTPLKFIWSCLCLVCTIVRPGKGVGVCRFHRRHLYQLLRVFVIWFVYRYALCPISLGRLYHWIRGQAMLKLYVLMAMVEVFDRLMCSFGQDALDSLYWNTTRRPYHPRMIASTMVVLVYATVHSLILFVHAATLNVAMNSADSALMSLLIGGNFAEIKSTVFKKYNKQNLFKITTSDICERFKLVLFLGLVLLLNCTQGGMNQEMVNDYIYMSFVIMGAEMVCDWIKHSFITKFNFIKSSVYLDYSLVLAGDVTGIGHESMHIEHTHAVVKRLGFAQIPLICVMLRYLKEASRYAGTLTHNGDSNHVLYSFAVVWTHGSWRMITNYLLSFFLCLLGLKFFLGYFITRKARSIILYGPFEGQVEPEPKRRQAV